MRLWAKIIAAGVAFALLAGAAWLFIPSPDSGPVLTFGVDPTRRGAHAGEYQVVFFDPATGRPDNFIAVASFTNNGRTVLRLMEPMVEWNEQPKLAFSHGWSGTPTGMLARLSLPPKAAAELPVRPLVFPWNHGQQKFRFKFDYTTDAGVLRRALSRIVGKVPNRLMPKSTADWLLRKGFMDGQFHHQFESAWMPDPYQPPALRSAGNR
jgi:hypothetical protein